VVSDTVAADPRAAVRHRCLTPFAKRAAAARHGAGVRHRRRAFGPRRQPAKVSGTFWKLAAATRDAAGVRHQSAEALGAVR